MKNILVTGGAGFVGSKLIKKLKYDYPNSHIVSLDNYFTGKEENHIPGVLYLEGNTKDAEEIFSNLEQEFDTLDFLSLQITQQEAYRNFCSDYGVVCGRIIVNNGFGVPNARVSIFVPLSDEDSTDPVISALYPYKDPSERNEETKREGQEEREKPPSETTHD